VQNLDNVDRAYGGFEEAELSKLHSWRTFNCCSKSVGNVDNDL